MHPSLTLTIAEALARRAADDPHGEVVRCVGGPGWSAADLWKHAATWARTLEELVPPGAVVVTAADTGPDAIALTAAVSALGGVELPLAPDAPKPWAEQLCRQTRPVAVVATAERMDQQPLVEALASSLDVPLLRVAADLDRPQPGASSVRPRPLASTDPALIMTTSGTTGRTKAALLPVGGPIAQALRVAGSMAYGPDDVVLNFFAWHHINARNGCFLPVLLSGARMVVAPRFSASRFLETVRAEQVTAFNFMGAVCAMLLAQPPSPRDRDHRVRVAYGGPAPAALVERFRDRFGVTLRQAYACTELGDVAVTPPTELRPGAAGRLVDDYDVRIVDPNGAEIPAGEAGELLVRPRRGGVAFLGYVGDERATREAWHDGWFRTRDRARTADGWLWVEGRLGDVIRRRGTNIDPQQVEQALLAHAGVAEAAAVAVPSELTEDELLAVVVLADGAAATPENLWAHCRRTLPRHSVPRYISIEPQLPHNANLKLDRSTLRQRGLPATAWDAGGRLPAITETR